MWEKLAIGNEILTYETFTISYNPDPGMGIRMFASDAGSPETALVVHNDQERNQYFILNGDFRKEYEALGDSLEKCFEFYKSKKEKYGSSWSTDVDALDILKKL